MPDLLNRTRDFIRNENLFPDGARVLVAVSGGLDSMVLLYILHHAGFNCEVIHINYGLRGEASDADEALVEETAWKYGIPVHIYKVDTKAQAKASGNSVQMEARDIRYRLFETELDRQGISWCATAHHQNDQAETLLMSFVKGRGEVLMQGIPIVREKYVRPLWFAWKDEMKTYAEENEIPWREDLSNETNDYTRNFIRNEVLPGLQKIHPNIERRLVDAGKAYTLQQRFIWETVERKIAPYLFEKGHQKILELSELAEEETDFLELIVRYWLEGEGLTGLEAEEASNLLHSESGKRVNTRNHVVIKTATGLAYMPSVFLADAEEKRVIESQKELLELGAIQFGEKQILFQLSESNSPDEPGNETIWGLMDAEKIQYPLTIRRWKQGDRMTPLGMAGQRKKLSDIFTSLKYSLFDKMEAIVFEDAGHIICLSEYRIADPVAIRSETKQILQIIIQS